MADTDNHCDSIAHPATSYSTFPAPVHCEATL